MNWDWINTTLVVLAILLVLLGIWFSFDSEFEAVPVVALLVGLFVFVALARSFNHASNLQDKAATKYLTQEGFKVVALSTNDHAATIAVGECQRKLELRSTQNGWRLYFTASNGERLLFHYFSSSDVGKACQQSFN